MDGIDAVAGSARPLLRNSGFRGFGISGLGFELRWEPVRATCGLADCVDHSAATSGSSRLETLTTKPDRGFAQRRRISYGNLNNTERPTRIYAKRP